LENNKVDRDHFIGLIEAIANSKTIIKLKILNQDLNHPKVIDLLCEMIERSQTLSHLELSWNNLSP
jgi:hypothetical protein